MNNADEQQNSYTTFNPFNNEREPKMSNKHKNNSNNSARQQSRENPLDVMVPSVAFPPGLQAIATAYGDYSKKSFENGKSFVEKLSAARSINTAVEVQAEFAKTAYETFVEESQKIASLHRDLVKQAYGGFGSKLPFTTL